MSHSVTVVQVTLILVTVVVMVIPKFQIQNVGIKDVRVYINVQIVDLHLLFVAIVKLDTERMGIFVHHAYSLTVKLVVSMSPVVIHVQMDIVEVMDNVLLVVVTHIVLLATI